MSKKVTLKELLIARIVLAVCIGFLSAVLRFDISSEVIGYLLMGVLVATSVIRTVLFCYMDAKGV